MRMDRYDGLEGHYEDLYDGLAGVREMKDYLGIVSLHSLLERFLNVTLNSVRNGAQSFRFAYPFPIRLALVCLRRRLSACKVGKSDTWPQAAVIPPRKSPR